MPSIVLFPLQLQKSNDEQTDINKIFHMILCFFK